MWAIYGYIMIELLRPIISRDFEVGFEIGFKVG
jgi:hypothetical protein